MKKEISTSVVIAALKVARDNFYESGRDMIDKISRYRDTGSLSCRFGDPTYEYAQFSEVMTGGFSSVPLQMVFESLVYLHYFNGVVELKLDPNDFVVRRKFDAEAFNTQARKNSEIIQALKVLELYVKRCLRDLGIKPEASDKVLLTTEYIIDTLGVIKHGMSVTLHLYGDHDFLVSKIPLGKDHSFRKDLPLNPHIFYTSKPEQILSLAHQVRPGVYIIANVPYGEHAETAFYILFRQEGYAYLVENSKHSYRDQHYRTKSDGTSGKDAWLDRKYEHCYLPVDIVMSFFNGHSHETSVALPGNTDFVSLGKITDCSAYEVLYTYAFIDKCYSFFNDIDFSSKISSTSCVGYISQLMDGTTENVPAIARSMLPAITDLNMSWSPETTRENFSKVFATAEAELPVVSKVDLSGIAQGSLTSIEHIRRSVGYRKRLQSTRELASAWEKDFLENNKKVLGAISHFIHKRGLKFLVRRSFEDRIYPLKVYRQFGSANRPVKPLSEGGYAYIDTTILFGYDVKRKDEHKSYVRVKSLTGHTQRHQTFHHSDERTILYMTAKDPSGWFSCCDCDKAVARYYYMLQFLDWEVFQSFFDIKDEELSEIPDQLKKYLNQAPTMYTGNSILNDIDPIALIQNPWFTAYINDSEVRYSQRDTPAFFVNFHLCGNCQLKYQRMK